MAYHFTDDIIDDVRERNDIVEVVSQFVELRRAGANYKANCPFHSEKTPSFVVSPDKQIYHCFGCGEGGNVINFIMKHENMEFVDAVKLLADRAGIYLEETNDKTDNRGEKERLYKINREAALYFFKSLKNSQIGMRYLSSRGIDNSIIKAFGLGYTPNSWDELLNYLREKGFKDEEIQNAGLIIKRKDQSGYFNRFRNRVMFPIIDIRGRVIGFGGRVLDNSQPKYMNSPDTPVFNKGLNLYGLNIAKKSSRGKQIVLVEGYMDVISLYKYGIDYGVASLGTALTKDQVKLLKRYSDTFYICYDTDDAGQKATDKAVDIFKNEGIDPKVILLPEGKDPDEYIKKHGKGSFEALMDKALNYIEYKIYTNKLKFDLDTLEGKIEFTKSVSKLLKTIKSPIEVDAYMKKISEQTGISLEAIKKETNNFYYNSATKTATKDKYRKNDYRYNNKDKIKPVEQVLESGHLIAEKSLLSLIIKNKDIYTKIRDDFKPDKFYNKTYQRLAEIIYKEYENKESILPENLIDVLNEQELKELKDIMGLELQIDNNDEYKAALDFINKINYFLLKIERQNIIEEIKIYENKNQKEKGDVERFKELCLKLIQIDKELKLHL